jgi:hypothetical protein
MASATAAANSKSNSKGKAERKPRDPNKPRKKPDRGNIVIQRAYDESVIGEGTESAVKVPAHWRDVAVLSPGSTGKVIRQKIGDYLSSLNGESSPTLRLVSAKPAFIPQVETVHRVKFKA